MTNPKFQIFKGENGKFYFRLTARNGQNILSSQGYAAKAGCQGGIESVRKNAQNPDAFEKKVSKNEKHYFNLLAANKQVIGSSQMYATAKSMQGGIDAVQRVASEALVEDTAV
jgi:uncharacterized protein YegP (UPF0339 family)